MRGARVVTLTSAAARTPMAVLRAACPEYDWIETDDISSVLALAARDAIDLFIAGIDLRGDSRVDELHARAPDVPIVFVSHAVSDEFEDVVCASWSKRQLRESLARWIENGRLRREVAGLRRLVGSRETAPDHAIASSAALSRVRHLVDRVDPLDLGVLLDAVALLAGRSSVPSSLEKADTAAAAAPPPADAIDPTKEISASLDSVLAAHETLPSLRDARDAFERAYLAATLRRSGGNVTHAARMAGRHRTDFYELLRRHGVSPAAFKRPGGSFDKAG